MIRAFRSAGSRFFAVDGLFLAAGLAFSSLVCLIPLVLLSVSAVGFVLSGERAAHEVVEQITRNFPVYRREISRALLALVETRRVSGLVGTVILVLFSTQLFSAARLVMHRVLGVRGGGFLGNFARDAFMVTVLSVFLFVSTAASWIVEWLQIFVLEPAQLSTRWVQGAWMAMSLGLSTMMLYLGYRHLPRRRVRPGAALAGALLASVLWELAKRL